MSGTDGPALRTRTSRSGTTVTVALAGELDLATAGSVGRCLGAAVQSSPAPTKLVLDLTELSFLDAAGISALLTARRALAARGGQTVLRSPSRLVRRVIKVLDLDEMLPVER